MLRELKFNYITYTVINSAAALTTLGFMTWWGRRTDRAGSIKILKITSFMIPFVPIMWVVSGNVYWIILVQILAGFAWSGFQLSSNIFIYDASPQENRTRYIALNNALLFLGISIGSLTGGLVAPHLPLIKGSYFLSIFLLSGLARLVVVLLFLPHISEVRDVPHVTAKELLLPRFNNWGLKTLSSSITKNISRWRHGK
jgi:MFS family permease